jgi:hypothetical protein
MHGTYIVGWVGGWVICGTYIRDPGTAAQRTPGLVLVVFGAVVTS